MAHDYSLYADSQTTGNITAEDIRDLHAQAILGTGISTKLLAKLFKRTFSSYKAPVTHIPTTPTAPATKYHGGAACVASTYSPQVIFVGFGSTTSASVPAPHALTAHLNLVSMLEWASCACLLASAIPVSVHAHSMLLPYSDATLIGIIPKRNDGTALKEGAKAVIGVFKDTAGGKVSEEELYQSPSLTVISLRPSAFLWERVGDLTLPLWVLPLHLQPTELTVERPRPPSLVSAALAHNHSPCRSTRDLTQRW